MDVKKIGETIRYLRIKAGYTQQEMANFFGISYQAVSKWERGICIPDAVYLPKLAQKLNVELDDLLTGNIKYLDTEWDGWLRISDCDFLLSGKKSILDMSLCYFMLAGIRNIIIQCRKEYLEQIKLHTESYAEKYGLRLCLVSTSETPVFNDQHVMLISAPVFMYGTNLTKYFWNAMSRKKGIYVLTTDSGDVYTRVSVEKNGLVRKDENGLYRALPVCFIPNQFFRAHNRKEIYANKMFYAEPTARGLIHKLINSKKEMEKVEEYIELVESMVGRKIYDMNEIAQARFLKNTIN